jgi:glycosyltransferase involved in cell wall biosynthesis
VKPVNILFVRPRVDLGGASRHMRSLAAALAGRGHPVALATSGGDWQSHFAPLPVYQIPLYPSTPVHLVLSAARLIRIVRQEDIQIIHSHHRFATLVGRVVSRLTGVPLVGTVHEFKMNWRWLSRLWLAPWVCAPSEALRAHLIRFNGLAPDRVEIVRLGALPISLDPAAVDRLRHLIGDGFNGPIVGYVGRLAPEKGVDTLIRSLPTVFRACPDAHVVIVGDGPERRALEGLAESLDVTDHVRWMGEQADASLLMTAMQVIAAPSRTENFSLTIAEAMAAARPVVACDVGGIAEMVTDGVTGFLIPSEDTSLMAQRIIGILADPSRAEAMGVAGQRKTAEWSPARAAEITEQLYQRALARR